MGVRPLFKKKKSINLLTIAIAIFIATIGILLYFIYIKFPNITGSNKPLDIPKLIKSPPGEIAFKNFENLKILVIGLDESRNDKGIIHHKGSRTDTIFILGLSKNANRLGMLSVPRDTWLKISDKYGDSKINGAYGFAFWDKYTNSNHDYNKAKTAGINQTKSTLENFLDTKINHYIIIKIQAAKELVDAIGGISINVEKDMDYDDNWGNLHIHLKKGRQVLNGTQAVGYARFRHDEEGDWGRIRRQQQVIKALVKELKKPKHIFNLNKIAKVIKDNVDTDIDINQLIDIAKVYKSFNPNNLLKGVITGKDKIVKGSMVVIPDNDIKCHLVTRIISNPATLEIKNQKIKLLNGCNIQGLGARTSESLKKEGYDVIEVGNSSNKVIMEKTKIINHYLNNKGAEKIKEILGLKEIEIIHNNSKSYDKSPDFTIILGKDCDKQEATIEIPKNSQKPYNEAPPITLKSP